MLPVAHLRGSRACPWTSIRFCLQGGKLLRTQALRASILLITACCSRKRVSIYITLARPRVTHQETQRKGGRRAARPPSLWDSEMTIHPPILGFMELTTRIGQLQAHEIPTNFAEMRTETLKIFRGNGEHDSSCEYKKYLVTPCDMLCFRDCCRVHEESSSVHYTLDRLDIGLISRVVAISVDHYRVLPRCFASVHSMRFGCVSRSDWGN